MNQKFITYEDTSSLDFIKLLEDPFNLIFELDKGYDIDLKQIINLCINKKSCRGIIFRIDDTKLSIGKLSFIGKMFEQLYLVDKGIGVWGVPTCVPRKFLSKYDYMRFLHKEIKEPVVIKGKKDNKVFLSECESCVDRNECFGFGNIDLATFSPRIKKISFEQLSNLYKNKPFSTDLKRLNDTHHNYLQHCYRDSPTAFRHIYYVNYINFGSQYSYTNRFVYTCDFLNLSEYKEEFNFMHKHVLNTKYIDLLESITSIEKTEQIAYSLVEKQGTYRESFYVATSRSYGKKILNDFHINLDFGQLNELSFFAIGIDIINIKIVCYKIYYHTSKTYISTYLENFNFNALDLKRNQHHFVLRLDREQNIISYKIDMYVSYEDFSLFHHLIKDYQYFDENFDTLGIYMIGIEIEANKITKINIYHRYM